MMEKNAEEEKRIALEKGNLLNGTPYTTVIGEGGWAKRSFGHGMNSLGCVVNRLNSSINKTNYNLSYFITVARAPIAICYKCMYSIYYF